MTAAARRKARLAVVTVLFVAAFAVDLVPWGDGPACSSSEQRVPVAAHTGAHRHAFTTATADGRATIARYDHAITGRP